MLTTSHTELSPRTTPAGTPSPSTENSRNGHPPSRPTLSLAIPTYNRSRYLAELLECLLPQVSAQPSLELIVSDNASPDDTEQIVAAFIARGLPCRYIRNPENVGADANFLQCLDLARGKYVWVMGDDDLLAPTALADLVSMLRAEAAEDYDLVYLSSAGFYGDHRPEARPDRLGRFAEVVTDGEYFLEKVNALIGLISANIVNKDRLLATQHPPLTDLTDSNLIQVGWLFPVIHRHCRILYVHQRLVFYRHFNSGGWGIAEVFGLRLHRIAQQYFAGEPTLDASLMNGVLRYWLPDVIVESRRGRQQSMNAEDFAATLTPIFRRNWRFWLFVYLVAVPPMRVSLVIHRMNRAINKASRGARAIFRHRLGRARVIRPTL
jgi:abequosyltransferase